MGTFLLVIVLLAYVFCCFILIAVILLQSGKGGGLSSLAGGGSGIQEALGATSAEKTLNRGTTMGAIGFMVLAIVLSIMGSVKTGDKQLFDKPVAPSTTIPTGSQPGTSVPLGETLGGTAPAAGTTNVFGEPVVIDGNVEVPEPAQSSAPETGAAE